MISKFSFYVFVFLLLFSLSCDNKRSIEPNIIEVDTNISSANKQACFEQIKSSDTVKTKEHKILKDYFGSMVTMPARSSLLVTQD